MHPFDISAVVLVSILAIIGIRRGFINEIFRLIAVFGGFAGALILYPVVFPYINFITTNRQIKTVIAFFAAYIALALTFWLIGWVLKKIIHLTLLGWADRLLGGVMGIAKSVIIIWAVVLTINLALPSKYQKQLKNAWTVKTINSIPLRLKVPDLKKIKHIPTLSQSAPLKDAVDSLKEKLDTIKKKISNGS